MVQRMGPIAEYDAEVQCSLGPILERWAALLQSWQEAGGLLAPLSTPTQQAQQAQQHLQQQQLYQQQLQQQQIQQQQQQQLHRQQFQLPQQQPQPQLQQQQQSPLLPCGRRAFVQPIGPVWLGLKAIFQLLQVRSVQHTESALQHDFKVTLEKHDL